MGKDISKAVRFMLDTAADDTHGYDQNERYGPDYDCSSLVAAALHWAGFAVSPYSWTGDLEGQLRNEGFVDCSPPWRPGDVHLKTYRHVVMSVDERQIVHASINEQGGTVGGMTGDQTGREVCVRDYYEYPGGWDVHLRYQVDTPETVDALAREVIAGKWGNGDERKRRLAVAGHDYAAVQSRVNAILKGRKSNEELAREVIAGRWGNGDERKRRLAGAGHDYAAIQAIVNRMLV